MKKINNKLTKVLALTSVAVACVAMPQKTEAHPGYGFGGPRHMMHGPRGGFWGHGGRNFWPGFVGGVAGGIIGSAIARPYYSYGYAAPVVYTTPTVYTTPVYTTPVYTQPTVITPTVTYQQPVAQPQVIEKTVIKEVPAQQETAIQQSAPSIKVDENNGPVLIKKKAMIDGKLQDVYVPQNQR